MEVLTIGPAHTLTEDTIYALPARAVYAFASVGLEVSATTGFTASQAVAANTPTLVNGGFVRSTTADSVVYLKAT